MASEHAAAAQLDAAAVIQVRGLRMSYDGTDAVAGIDFDVFAGEVVAFLGPNGAGKTTTVEILEGYRRRSGGDVSVLGIDPASAGAGWRARIGVVLQESEPEPELTVEECASLYAGYYPHPRTVADTLELVGLANRGTARCGRLVRRPAAATRGSGRPGSILPRGARHGRLSPVSATWARRSS